MEDQVDVTEPVPVDPTDRVELVLVQPLRAHLFEEEPTVEESFPFMDDHDTEPTFTGIELPPGTF